MKAPSGGGVPWMPVAIIGGALVIVLLIAYLIFQSVSDSGEGLSAARQAELDDSPDLPGMYVPPQGQQHLPYQFSEERAPRPFCEGVEHAEGVDDEADDTGNETPAATPTPADDGETPDGTPDTPSDCYNSNPPSSGDHLGSAGNVEIGDGLILPSIPPDPNVYPPDVIIPREAIPHILEHAGVFVGYHCADGDEACQDVVSQLEDLVNNRIDNHNDRVVMANDPDLPVGTIGVSSWTRVLTMPHEDYDEDLIEDFIGTHSCRFDPEGFC